MKLGISAGVLGLILLAGFLAPVVAPFDPTFTDLGKGLLPPGSRVHFLGTDQLGRDLFSRVLFGARLAFLIGFSAVVAAAAIGSLFGLFAGYLGGWTETLLMRIADVQLSFPFVLLALTINAIVGLGVANIILSLAASGWVVYARVVRSEVLSVRRREFIEAAEALGLSRQQILFRHIFPNVAPSVLVVASLQFSQFILAEAAISFLGFGIQPPTPAWGSMLAEGRDFLYVAWWLAFFPGLALTITALNINILGTSLAEYLNPKLRSRRGI